MHTQKRPTNPHKKSTYPQKNQVYPQKSYTYLQKKSTSPAPPTAPALASVSLFALALFLDLSALTPFFLATDASASLLDLPGV